MRSVPDWFVRRVGGSTVDNIPADGFPLELSRVGVHST